MALLDCRDTRISLWQDSGAVHSPGVVLHDGNRYVFGEAAMEQARQRPRDSNSRFWWQLSTQPLKPALGPARHTADLVHSHLREVHAEAGAPDTLTFAVPDSMPREQLSLLLGVAQACEFTVAGLVSRSVLLGSRAMREHGASRALHVEAQLNQAIINELQEEDGELRLLRSTPLPACGLLALQERAVGAIASAFIQQTRFDPRRSASSEQALYNQLQTILATVRERGEASVDIDGHRCRITASALAGSSQRLLDGLDQVRDGRSLPLLLDPELAALPGVDSLAEALTLRTGLLWEAWQEQQGKVELGEDEVHLIDRLPLLTPGRSGGGIDRGAAAAPAPAASPGPAGRAPSPSEAVRVEAATHLLLGVRALPLRGRAIDLGHGFELRRDGATWTVHGDGALINGLPATPVQPLVLGDTLSLGAAGHGRLIEVVE
ncbi:MAG: hypothetical protein V2I24_03330 [Halieaceae bacterium]|jgi:hypothetical protein|nr:hypothetical protein [Halieaceae bacterium]